MKQKEKSYRYPGKHIAPTPSTLGQRQKDDD